MHYVCHPLSGNTAYGDTGIRDVHLEMANVRLDGRKGTLHFIRFPTADMDKFILLCKMKNLKSVAKTICATGSLQNASIEFVECVLSSELPWILRVRSPRFADICMREFACLTVRLSLHPDAEFR